MNTQENNLVPIDGFFKDAREKEEVAKLAAVGLHPSEIAAAMGWEFSRRLAFVALAATVDSSVAACIAEGRVSGVAVPQIKLQEAAAAGNIDAIKELQKIQARNLFNERVRNIDDDEFAI